MYAYIYIYIFIFFWHETHTQWSESTRHDAQGTNKNGGSAPFIEKKIGDSAPFIMEQKRSSFNSLPTRRAAAIPSGHLWVT